MCAAVQPSPPASPASPATPASRRRFATHNASPNAAAKLRRPSVPRNLLALLLPAMFLAAFVPHLLSGSLSLAPSFVPLPSTISAVHNASTNTITITIATAPSGPGSDSVNGNASLPPPAPGTAAAAVAVDPHAEADVVARAVSAEGITAAEDASPARHGDGDKDGGAKNRNDDKDDSNEGSHAIATAATHENDNNGDGDNANHIEKDAYTPPPPDFPAACHFVSHDPAAAPPTAPDDDSPLWRYNARALCLVPAFCLRPSTATALAHLYLGAPPAATACHQARATLASAGHGGAPLPPATCARMQAAHVHTPHGRYRGIANGAVPPAVRALDALPAADRAAAALVVPPDAVAVVVPPHPWLGNIFHFSFVLGSLTHAVSSLPVLTDAWRRPLAAGADVRAQRRRARPRRVTVVFRAAAPAALGKWAGNLTAVALAHAARRAGLDAPPDVVALDEDTIGGSIDPAGNDARPVCASAGVLLGARGNTALWPFPNGSAVATTGRAVSIESVALRAAVYEAMGVYAGPSAADHDGRRLPDGVPRAGAEEEADLAAEAARMRGGDRAVAPVLRGFPKRARFAAPPLVIGYARRETVADPPPGKTLRDYWRRFSDDDEAWFLAMLHEEAQRAGARVTELTATRDMPIDAQIRWYERAGVVVGIHGANLVNGMFVRPFGALLEVFAGGHFVRCYHAGGNAGLAYWAHRAAPATREESFCGRGDRCWNEKMQRRIKIGDPAHRSEVRRMVREALLHVKTLRERFPDGVPVRLDEGEGRYVIDE